MVISHIGSLPATENSWKRTITLSTTLHFAIDFDVIIIGDIKLINCKYIYRLM